MWWGVEATSATGGAGVSSERAEPTVVVYDGGTSFDELYRREHRPLLRLAWSLTGRRDLAEELVQDAMLAVHRDWDRVRRYESPGGFARRVLLNAATSAARRHGAEQRAMSRLTVERTHRDELPPDESFWAALRSLPERQAHAVALHYLEDLPVSEIAHVLDIAEGTVKVHLHRGRLALADLLRDELEEASWRRPSCWRPSTAGPGRPSPPSTVRWRGWNPLPCRSIPSAAAAGGGGRCSWPLVSWWWPSSA